MFGYDIVYLIMIVLGAAFASALYFVNGIVLHKDNINNKVKSAGVFALSTALAVPSAFLLNYLLHPIAWGDTFSNLSGLAFHMLYSCGFMFLYSGVLLPALKLDAADYLNAAVPSIAILIGISKIGCIAADCCGGIALENFVIPTAVIECAAGFLLFVAFQFFIKTNRLPKYLVVYGVFRFFVEFLRADANSVMIFKVLKPEQLFAAIMVLMGIILMSVLCHKKIKNNSDKKCV